MIIVDYVRAMAGYNLWMNKTVYDAAGTLSDIERKRDLGAFFKSLHGTLNHILLGDRMWFGRFTGVDPGLTDLIYLPGMENAA